MTDPVLLFRDELVATFGQFDDRPIPDGKIHRFHVPGDRAGSRNGWYVLHLEGIAYGAFGSWKASGSQSWSSRQPADPFEADRLRRLAERARRQREAEQHQRQQEAAREAQRLPEDGRLHAAAAWIAEEAKRMDVILLSMLHEEAADD